VSISSVALKAARKDGPGRHCHLRASVQVRSRATSCSLDAIDPDPDTVAELKDHYRRGGLADMVLNRRLTAILQATIVPISHATWISS
jgi:tryptophanyl-tRNA synthetase